MGVLVFFGGGSAAVVSDGEEGNHRWFTKDLGALM